MLVERSQTLAEPFRGGRKVKRHQGVRQLVHQRIGAALCVDHHRPKVRPVIAVSRHLPIPKKPRGTLAVTCLRGEKENDDWLTRRRGKIGRRHRSNGRIDGLASPCLQLRRRQVAPDHQGTRDQKRAVSSELPPDPSSHGATFAGDRAVGGGELRADRAPRFGLGLAGISGLRQPADGVIPREKGPTSETDAGRDDQAARDNARPAGEPPACDHVMRPRIQSRHESAQARCENCWLIAMSLQPVSPCPPRPPW